MNTGLSVSRSMGFCFFSFISFYFILFSRRFITQHSPPTSPSGLNVALPPTPPSTFSVLSLPIPR
jgi:hypothetical protein